MSQFIVRNVELLNVRYWLKRRKRMNTHNRLYALPLCALVLAVLLGQAPQARAQDQDQQLHSPQAVLASSGTDTLDMTGDWKLTYGYNLAGCCTRTYNVHFDRGVSNPSGGFHHIGRYLPGGDPHSSLLETTPDALTVDTFYGGRGQVVVQIMEHVVDSSGGYFSLLSGYHVPGKLEIQGVWANINQDRGTFTLVKVP